MTKDLKPCPFCGGEDLSISVEGYVYCGNCDATGPSEFSPEQAEEHWNTRAAADPPATTSVYLDDREEALLLRLIRVTSAQLYHASGEGIGQVGSRIARAELDALALKLAPGKKD